jgi:hypothetical protein
MATNIDEIMVDYFSIINTLPYKEVSIKNILNSNDIYSIVIKVNTRKETHSYYNRSGNVNTILEQIRQDMEDMFPYSFIISCDIY